MTEDDLIGDQEPILVRPAETEMRFDHFAGLLTGDTSLSPSHQLELFGNLTYYLCKHGLDRW